MAAAKAAASSSPNPAYAQSLTLPSPVRTAQFTIQNWRMHPDLQASPGFTRYENKITTNQARVEIPTADGQRQVVWSFSLYYKFYHPDAHSAWKLVKLDSRCPEVLIDRTTLQEVNPEGGECMLLSSQSAGVLAVDVKRKGSSGSYKLSERRCDYCKRAEKAAINQCTRCQYARYCSRECQTADWQRHGPECSQLTTARIGPENPAATPYTPDVVANMTV